MGQTRTAGSQARPDGGGAPTPPWSRRGIAPCRRRLARLGRCKPGDSRAAWAPSAVEDPGDGDLEAFGEEVGGVAPRVRSDGRIGGWRRERLESQPGGDDPE